MKYEQVLQIYWSKGFLFNSRLTPFTISFDKFLSEMGGVSYTLKLFFVKRFEFFFFWNWKHSLSFLSKNQRLALNIILSQLSTVNNQIIELVKLSQIKLYLIKTYKGKSHAIGKPVRGQRTWSNAWTTYFLNKDVRNFISTTQKLLNTKKIIKKIDFRKLEKKVVKKTTTTLVKKKKLKTWF